MKAIMTSRFLLLIFVCNIVFGCTQNASFADPSADLLNNISERFKTNEYVNALDMGFTNPHEQWGEKVENLFQKMIKHPLITEIKRSPYNASITTLGIKDPNKLILAKTISTEILSSEGYSISEKQLDDMNSWFNKYLFHLKKPPALQVVMS